MSWFKDKYGENAHPILPAELFSKLYDLWHGDEDAVIDIVQRVQEGKMTVEDVKKALGRPDIDPEKWRDFEEGWRPDDWD